MSAHTGATAPLPILYSDGTGPLGREQAEQLQRLAAQVEAEHAGAVQCQLVLTDDALIQQLNRTYRGKDAATDVLSFDLGGTVPGAADTNSEIYVSLERAAVQAAERGVPCFEEVARLLTHGLLHLAGWVHERPEQLRAMEDETDRLLQQAGLLASPSSR